MTSTPPERTLAPPPARFAAHGVAVVRGLVDAARLPDLRAAFDRLFAAVPARHALEEIVRPSTADPAFTALLADEAFVAPLRAVLRTDRVQLLQEVLLRKRPGDAGTVAWHRDASYLGYLDPLRVVSLRLALSPCTRAHGCLVVLDGSHRWTYDTPPRTGATVINDALAGLPPELGARVPDALAAIELAPGDASIHDARTLHGSGPNRSDGVRRTLVVHAFDAACRLVPAQLPAPAARHLFPTDAGGHLTGPSFPLLPLRPDARGRS